MRSLAKSVLRRFGFRNVLLWNTLISSFFMALCGIFTVDTPHAVMMGIIFCGGVFRSLQFTALNTIGFAEVSTPLMSQATSFSQMAQRLSLSFGVAISAFVLHWTAGAQQPLPVHSFATAFVVIGILSGLSVVSFFSLPADAGAEIAGRQPVRSRRFER
jgi:hypothetical protein